MIVTVDAKPGQVRQLLAERGIDPLYCEWDDVSCTTEVGVVGHSVQGFVMDLVRSGFRWWRGAPRGLHADPTYAMAAQRVVRRGH